MTELTEAWINIYKHKNSYWCGTPNHTKSGALLHLADTENYLTTVNIEQLLKLQEQNTKLKELLKECRALLSCLQIDDYDGNGLLVLAKIKQALGEE